MRTVRRIELYGIHLRIQANPLVAARLPYTTALHVQLLRKNLICEYVDID